MTSLYGKYIPIVFILILLFSIADLLTTYSNLNTVRNDERMVDHTYRMRQELANTLIALDDTETGQRGYLITGDDKFLEPYTGNVHTIGDHIAILKQLTRDNQLEQKKISELEDTAKIRISYLQKGIDLEKKEGYQALEVFSMAAQGRLAMSKARTLIAAVDQEEQKLLEKRHRETANSYNTVYFSSAFASVLNLLLVFLAFYLVRREIQIRNELERNKDDFISMASHELKTPITSLKVYANVAMRKLDAASTKDAEKYLKRIDEQANRLSSLIRDMLDISRIQTGKLRILKEPFDLNSLLEETVEAMQQTTNKHRILVKSRLKQMINGDRYRIYQVLVNLLTNAIKYSPDGGRIIVTTQDLPHAMRVSVKDTGIGVDARFRKRIFERLYQVSDQKDRRTYPGLGIGLFISSEIIRAHGGKIWVESKKGRGSTFFFTIPYDK